MLGLRPSSGMNFSPKCTWSLLIRSNWRMSAEIGMSGVNGWMPRISNVSGRNGSIAARVIGQPVCGT